HATAGVIAGGDPEKIQRLPDMDGLPNEVIAPDYSRNVYDHAIRMVGARMITVRSLEEMAAAIGPRTAMVMVLASPSDTGEFGLEPIAKLAHEHGVPVLVDAAAEGLTIVVVCLVMRTHVAQDLPTCHRVPQLFRRRLLQSGYLEGKGKREQPESRDQEFHA
ncbi:MAG: hypothetical protein OXC19_08250, partial [Bryobacterales bacterium]|nr:hypothetical protein [Bryobacterales bacterium]